MRGSQNITGCRVLRAIHHSGVQLTRVGKAKAITATARKLALLVYRVLAGKLLYQDPGAAAYHQLNRRRELKWLRKRADQLGFDLLDRSTGEVLLNANTVS